MGPFSRRHCIAHLSLPLSLPPPPPNASSAQLPLGPVFIIIIVRVCTALCAHQGGLCHATSPSRLSFVGSSLTMSAPPPEDEQPAMLPFLPAQAALSAVATPADAAAASTADTSIASPEGDSPPSERRGMSFEEFRQFYVASQRLNYLSNQRDATGVSSGQEDGGAAAHDTVSADTLAGEAARQHVVVGTLRRRIVGTNEDSPTLTQTAAAAAAPATPPPAAQAPPPLLGHLARVTHAVGGCLNWLANRVARNRAHLLQLLLVFFVLYVQVKLSSTHVICLLVLYITVKGVQEFVRNFQISHETGTTGAPSLLGRLFKPEGHVGSVSKLRKIGYVVAKCAEAFLLSFFPTYSLEHLERELCADGIVR
ncbi:conserved hypothetical protein [Leishmania mexicana MHOM/GT/2001/U1103]|uniref:Uncharacterized protein n=1 Tax=Leishmania mexicana (strain MHOM/GT/2001/U1103) TaxID=929439 RepID=E9AQ18_LEIMU|nr:conserved hypothetical protein [Leishmania mexicana MHOM/GT/2001/U1103]CBZ25036.1 conserved hypothetical protein [Leishmania mexicana MHOM/GT/2001/U1103]